ICLHSAGDPVLHDPESLGKRPAMLMHRTGDQMVDDLARTKDCPRWWNHHRFHEQGGPRSWPAGWFRPCSMKSPVKIEKAAHSRRLAARETTSATLQVDRRSRVPLCSLAARGESLAAFGAPGAAAALGTPFDGRCIPAPPQRGCRV